MWKDLRFALRSVRIHSGYSLVFVASLALAIGANSAIFSVIHAVLLRPLPFDDPQRLVMVYEADPAMGLHRGAISYPEFRDIEDSGQTFTAVAAVSPRRLNLVGDHEAEPIQGEIVSVGYFSLLGLAPGLGRLLQPSDGKAPVSGAVCVLGYGLWQRRFGGDRGVVEKSVTLGSTSFTVVGVAPRGFAGLHGDAELWIPMSMQPTVMQDDLLSRRGSRWLSVVGRLRPGVGPARAQSDLGAFARRVLRTADPGWGERTLVLRPLHDEVVGPALRRSVEVLMAAVGFVLLIACANLINLTLVRAARREKEIAIRLTVGASRFQLVRQLLTESVVLALLGGIAGVAVAYGGIELLLAFKPPNLHKVEASLDAVVLAFTLSVSLLAGLVVGLAPAVQTSRSDLNLTLKG